ncbi:hypothetical protein [Rhizobium gallicum]|uniref:hypothetical protein n=1 Tax=Rhizobium gallicum TaxID=56730 RepID=UPI001EF954E4|nr:hypothetical protein [Rhizobium gallicum]ULJ74351.1 hypothetical protein L2W42_23470 [Rhizobium gallicum]
MRQHFSNTPRAVAGTYRKALRIILQAGSGKWCPIDGPNRGSGPAIHLLIHVLEGKLHEFEVYKDDGTAITVIPADVDLNRSFFRPPTFCPANFIHRDHRVEAST